MFGTVDASHARTHRRMLLALLVLVSFASLGPLCVPVADEPSPDPDPGNGGSVELNPPAISATLNGIPADTNAILVVPPSGFVLNVDWAETDAPIDRSSMSMIVSNWDGSFDFLTSLATSNDDGMWLVLPEARALTEGTYTLYGQIADVDGRRAQVRYDFAVRQFAGGVAPIGQGQQVWFDFDADRDTDFGPDFDVDLEVLGFTSAAASAEMHATMRGWIIADTLERVRVAYYDSQPTGLLGPDPIDIGFSDVDPALPDTTRICVGGEDPTGGITLGNVQLDPGNARRDSVECGTLPPTGVFPREILMYTQQVDFQQTVDPLRPAAGGTAVGEHAEDALVLAAGFVPGHPDATPAQIARFDQIEQAVAAFSAALGTVLAHETGHALGLVPENAPGIGLYGGPAGATYAHNLMPDGALPSEDWLMNRGGQFTFAELAALGGNAPVEFRPLNHAYLRDRLVMDSRVTALFMPPIIGSVDPPTVTQSFQTITVHGEGFEPTPAVVLQNEQFTYHAIGENFVNDVEFTAAIIRGQIVPGIYDLIVTNPDGQAATLSSAITVE